MSISAITDRVREALALLPEGVLLVGAAKTRTPEEALAAMEGGLAVLGHNYVQEAEAMRATLTGVAVAASVRWHFIGHLQRNKAKRAVAIFDMVEAVDSVRLAEALDRHGGEADKVMPLLVEINSGREPNKTGVLPEDAEDLVRRLATLPNVRVQGLMTMGPFSGDPEQARPCFRQTRETFDRLAAASVPNVEMRYLSMGMSNSYRVAIQEGANIVRLGTVLFGPRSP